MTKPTKVVCLGGGYAAMHLVMAMKKAIKKGIVELTVIDKNNYHTFHGLIAEMLGGQLQPGQIASPSRRLFKPARFHNAIIDDIDIKNNRVITFREFDNKQFEVVFDHLVVSLGSVDDLSRYPGIAEHTFRLKNYWDCFEVRSHIIHMLELAEIETDPIERKRLLNFVIVGGNYAGVEVATELPSLFNKIRSEFPGLGSDEMSVNLVHSGSSILPELNSRYPKLVSAATKHITRQSNLNIILNTRIKSATRDEAVFEDGSKIQTRTIISCTGNAQSPLLEKLGLKRDKTHRLVTDPYGNAIDRKNIWAAGDCAAVPMTDGGTAPPLAIFAMTAGSLVGKNILNSIQKRPLEKYRFTGLGDAASLGNRTAVGHFKGIPLLGFHAWVVWRIFMFFYLPTWDRRLRALSDWLLWPIIGRDIVSIQKKEGLGISKKLFEPGQLIVVEGDIGKDLYVIQSGKVEIIKEGSGKTEVLSELGPGSHFGEQAIYSGTTRTASVRAKTRVELLAISKSTALTLGNTLETFGSEISALPGQKL